MRSVLLVALILAAFAFAAPADAVVPPPQTAVGSSSWAARVVVDDDGSFRATITSCGAKTGSTDGVGALVLDADQALRFGIGVTGHGSPDRTLTQIAGLVDDVSVTYPSYGPICPYSRMTLTVGGAPGSTHYVVMWGAGLDGPTSFGIESAGSATWRQGSARALGDPELSSEAGANVQVQRRVSGFQGVGVKLIQDASLEVEVAERAWGFWGYNDAKFVCAPAGCAGPATADQACLLAAGTTCGTRISWSGPAGSGAGAASFTLLGEPAGNYAFRVDRKVDAYNPGGGAYVPPGILVFPGENYGFLSLADVSLPS